MKTWFWFVVVIALLVATIILSNCCDDSYAQCDPYGTMDYGCRAQEMAR